MTKLSVNVNKIATLRNARGQDVPNVVAIAQAIVSYGADGITVHPRPDGRHIRTRDVEQLKENLDVELNIEGYPTDEFLLLVNKVRPAQCTLVPDLPDAVTSNAGWRVSDCRDLIRDVCRKLDSWQVRSSFFVEPGAITQTELEFLKSVGASRIELYTENYAKLFGRGESEKALAPYRDLALKAGEVGLGLNAGHDLNQSNLRYFAHHIPALLEVSIGHALISEALIAGLEKTVQAYLDCLK